MSKYLKVYLSPYDTHEQTTIKEMIKNLTRVSMCDVKDECPHLIEDSGDSIGELKDGYWALGEYGYYIVGYTKRKAAMNLREEIDYDREVNSMVDYEMER